MDAFRAWTAFESVTQEKRKPELGGRSPVRAAVIAVLLESPCHGYEIASRLKMRLGPSWRIYAKHLYPVLEALEKDQLVRSEDRPSERGDERKLSKTARRVYFPTPAALEARDEWMEAPILMTLMRSDIQAHLAFAREEEAPKILRLLDRYEEDLIVALEANAVVDVPRASWLGLVIGEVRASVARRLDAEIAWVGDLRRHIEEFTARAQ
jgi:DNA-binding PadR family transcriptional regulator